MAKASCTTTNSARSSARRAAHGGLVGHALRGVGTGNPQRADLAVGSGLKHLDRCLAWLAGHVGHAPPRSHLGAVGGVAPVAVRAEQVGHAAHLAPAHGVGLARQASSSANTPPAGSRKTATSSPRGRATRCDPGRGMSSRWQIFFHTGWLPLSGDGGCDGGCSGGVLALRGRVTPVGFAKHERVADVVDRATVAQPLEMPAAIHRVALQASAHELVVLEHGFFTRHHRPHRGRSE